MTAVVGPAPAPACHTLLAAATDRAATADLVAAVFAGFTDPDVDAALAQLATAGLTR